MKKRKQILISCILSIIILGGIYFIISRGNVTNNYKIFVLKNDISAGTVLDQSMLNTLMLPEEAMLSNCKFNINQIAGKILLRNMQSGDVLSIHDFDETSTTVLYPDLDIDKEIYSIAVKPENANAWWLYAGNHVNIYIYQPDSTNNRGSDSSGSTLIRTPSDDVMILENIRMMKITNEIGNITSSNDKTRIICLELTAEQIKCLAAAERAGIIRLSAINNQHNMEETLNEQNEQ